MLLSKETSLFKVNGVKDNVDSARTTATNYITQIDSNGIRVHATNNTTSNYARVNANGLQVYKGSNEVASFGDEAVIGKTDDKHAHITSGGFYVYSGTEADSTRVAQLGYGSGQTSSGGTSSKPYTTLGQRSTSSGRTTIGNWSVAEGYDNFASGYTAHAEGEHCDATGHWSHSEGKECKANALNAHAGGWLAEALHQGGFAHGYGVKTNMDWQTVLGRYNALESNTLLVIGYGSGDNARSTVFKVGTGGEIYAQGHSTPIGSILSGNFSKTLASGTTLTDLSVGESLPAGSWVISYSMQFPANSAGSRGSCIQCDGNEITASYTCGIGGNAQQDYTGTGMYSSSSTISLSFKARQSTGSSQTVTGYWQAIRIA